MALPTGLVLNNAAMCSPLRPFSTTFGSSPVRIDGAPRHTNHPHRCHQLWTGWVDLVSVGERGRLQCKTIAFQPRSLYHHCQHRFHVYTDTNVLPGTTYYYVVSAAGGGGESPNSDPVSVRTPLPPVPDPVIGYVNYPPPDYLSVLNPVSSYIANNDIAIVIQGAAGSEIIL